MATKELISTVTVGAGGSSSINFASIPQDGTDLFLTLNLRGDATTITSRFNADSGSNYTYVRFLGTGSAVSPSSGTSTGMYNAAGCVNVGWTESTFSNVTIYIPNYSLTGVKYASVDSVTEQNSSLAYVEISGHKWSGTSAINQFTVLLNAGGNFAEGSTASLYKITKGSGGASVA